MSARGSKINFWDWALYVGIFILVMAFLYQLLKIYNAGAASLSGVLSSVGAALSNTVAAVENTFSSIVSGALSPFVWLSNAFGLIPYILTGIFALIGSLDPTGIFTWIANIASSFFTAVPVSGGAGTSYTPTGASTATAVPYPVYTNNLTPVGGTAGNMNSQSGSYGNNEAVQQPAGNVYSISQSNY